MSATHKRQERALGFDLSGHSAQEEETVVVDGTPPSPRCYTAASACRQSVCTADESCPGVCLSSRAANRKQPANVISR